MSITTFLIVCPLVFLAGFVDAIAGNYLGSRCFQSGGTKFTKPVMLLVLLVFFIKTVLELVQGAA